MTEAELILIEKTINLLNANATNIVTSYTNWFIYNSIASLILWFSILLCSIWGFYVFFRKEDSTLRISGTAGFSMIIIIASLVLCYYIANAVAPDAAAIHQLLKDLK